jgi:hypothetical protein
VFTKTSRLILLGHKLLTILDKNEWNWARKQKEKVSNIEGRRQSDFLEKKLKSDITDTTTLPILSCCLNWHRQVKKT